MSVKGATRTVVFRGGSWGLIGDTWLRCACQNRTGVMSGTNLVGFRTFRPSRQEHPHP